MDLAIELRRRPRGALEVLAHVQQSDLGYSKRYGTKRCEEHTNRWNDWGYTPRKSLLRILEVGVQLYRRQECSLGWAIPYKGG
jgi:hypothetical protein